MNDEQFLAAFLKPKLDRSASVDAIPPGQDRDPGNRNRDAIRNRNRDGVNFTLRSPLRQPHYQWRGDRRGKTAQREPGQVRQEEGNGNRQRATSAAEALERYATDFSESESATDEHGSTRMGVRYEDRSG